MIQLGGGSQCVVSAIACDAGARHDARYAAGHFEHAVVNRIGYVQRAFGVNRHA